MYRFSTKLLSALAILAICLASVPGAGAAAADNACYSYRRGEKRFKKQTNRARARNDVGPLKLDPELSKVARVHSRDMAKKGEPAHSDPSVLGARVTNWDILGENVGMGTGVVEIQRAFMSSDGHRANILDPSFKRIGVGTVRKDGLLFVTVIFESHTNPGTSLAMPSCST